ncbi:MAG TPA: ATP-binding cassette domain-containing protein [Nitrospirales bacterium]|jgi:ABC-type Mn2+/Zn2+ transport system ATPase subunit|nr:ATP-binding cassette domain-containing protein [Nitrospirales bacterium]
MTDALISFQDVALGYDGVPVLEGLTLDVHRGDFLALVGPNGCGKSTILKGMARILEPFRGRIVREIDGRPVRFGYVPQREAIEMVFPLTVFQVALMGTYGRVGPGRPVTHADRERVRICLDDVGLGDLQRKLFPALSGGQRQRVLIARALAAEPDLLLLDEPLSGIDLGAAQVIMDLIERLHRERSLTIVMVSHHLKMLREHEMVREVIWVHEGKLLRGSVAAMLAPEAIVRMMDAEIG